MKKTNACMALIFCLLFVSSGQQIRAEENEYEYDAFNVLQAVNAPKECINRNIDNNALLLGDLIEIAMCNNPLLSQSWLAAKKQAASYGQALSSYLPDINLSVSGTLRESKAGSGSWSDSADASASVGLSWLIWDFGGREASVDLAKSNLLTANFTSSQTMQDTVFNVVQAYYNLLSADAELKVAKENEETYRTSFNIASKRYELGLVSLSDKLNAETSYAQSQLTTVQAGNSVELAKGTLAELLNLSAATQLNLAAVELEYKDGMLKTDAADLIQEALNNRSDLKAAQESIKAAEYQLKKSEAENYPSVSLSGQGQTGNSFSGRNSQSYGGHIGIGVSVPLFTGFSNTYNTMVQKYNLQNTQKQLEAKISTARKNVWTAYQNYQTAVKNSEIADKLFVSSSQNYKVAVGAYKVGKNDILTLLEAQYKLAVARKEKSSALYGLFLAKNELLRAIGKMEMVQ